MKYLLPTLVLFTSAASASTPEMEIQGTIKQDGTQSRFRTEKAVVTKVYSAESEGASFRAYAIKWNDFEVIISDTPSPRKKVYQVGDTITFMVNRIDLQREGSVPILSFMLMPEFEMPTKEKKDVD
jgi:hypothetical protein